MKISEILTKENIIKDLKSFDKESVLEELSNFLKDRGEIPNKKNLLLSLIEREKLGSTGIGENVAIPHAKIRDIDKIITVFARSQIGVEFESLDQKPVNFIYLILFSLINLSKLPLLIFIILQTSSLFNNLLISIILFIYYIIPKAINSRD